MVPQTGCKQSLELFSHGLCAAARFSISGPRYNFYIVSSSPMARGNYLVTFCFLWFLNLQVFQVSWKEQYQLAQSVFEDQFSPSRKNVGWRKLGWYHPPGVSTWQLLWLAVERSWSVLGRPLLLLHKHAWKVFLSPWMGVFTVVNL